MKDVRDNNFSFLDDWYGRLNDIIEDLKEHDFDVLNATSEWIDVSKDDNEYVLKLGGTERTITIDKIESLNESIKTLKEGGIYPVVLVGGADEAFLDVVNEILGGEIVEVNNLELIPSLGFGGSGRYWYRAAITLDEATIVNFISTESTPEAKRLLNNETLVINPYSDISIECSANSAQYIDGTTLDALSDSDADMKVLDNESDSIGNAIITKLIEAEDKIIEVLKKYEDIDEDEFNHVDESLIPIQEYWDDDWDDDELANIYGGDTAQSQKDIADDELNASKLEVYGGDKEPKLGKKIKQLKGWKIYHGTNSYGEDIFRCFTPDEDRPEVGYEDWECETLEQAISWIENYDLEESKKINNEDNKETIKESSEGESSDLENEIIIIESQDIDENEKLVYDCLDNIEFLVSSYDDFDIKTLGNLIDKIKDEMKTLDDAYMKLRVGIKQYTL